MGDSIETILLEKYSPHQESLHNRYYIYKLLKAAIYRALEKKLIKVTVYGSLPLRTFLNEGDIDITVITTPEDSQCPYLYLSKIKHQISQDFQVSTVQEVYSDVPILKLQLLNVSVDISINQIGGVRSLIFLEEISRLFPKHLMKKSFILCKAWAVYYSRILGSMNGLLSTYALEIIVLCVLNTFPECRTSALDVLSAFIMFLSNFDWESQIITCCGIVPVTKYDVNIEELAQGDRKLQLTYDKIQMLRDELKCTQCTWNTRYVNIADPVFPGNNLGKSISFNTFSRFQNCFKVGYEIVKELGVEGLFRKKVPQVAIENELVLEERLRINVVPISFFANIRKLKEALFSCLAVMDPSYPQNYKSLYN